ncbi:hypothetical protein O3P69_012965 [Scylla paramamosain]|uniref:Nuclear cap-binding protein subunit 2 n=2 Tax=Scylla paramamosain TaxID=85552 RepID=A0AAW0TQM9_SCYPA
MEGGFISEQYLEILEKVMHPTVRAYGTARTTSRALQVFQKVQHTATEMSMMTPSIDLSSYRDQHFKGSRADQERMLHLSTTLYVGNLSFYTTEEQLYELFGRAGDVKKIVMGLDKFKKTPCGFCFVEYFTRDDAEMCMRFINGTRLDDRIVRTDWDAGFVEGRQYGRGKSGGQVRDEYRTDYDSGRGGYGKIVQQKMLPKLT